MKKSVMLVFIIGLLVFGGAIYGIHQVTNQADDMTIECRVLDGKPEVAANIAFKIHNQWSERLDWEVQGSFDSQGEAHIEVLHSENWMAPEQFRKRTYFSYGYDRDVEIYPFRQTHLEFTSEADRGGDWFDSQHDSYIEAFRAVAAKTPTGQMYSEVVKLGEYVDYYTLNLELYCVDRLFWPYDATPTVSDFFKIKIPSSHVAELYVEKDEKGNVIGYGETYYNTSGDVSYMESGAVYFSTCGDVGNEGVYFSFHGGTNNKEYEPISIGCGNGIFLLPLTENAEGEFVAEISSLNKVFELPEEECYPIELLVDVQKENLLLFTKEKDKLVFRCIDIDSMQETVKEELTDFEEGAEIIQLHLYESEMFLILADSTFAYFRKENDCMKPQIITSLETEGLHISANYQLEGLRLSPNYQLEYDWDYQDG